MRELPPAKGGLVTRLSRQPSPVQYPLRRSRILGVLLAALVLAGACVLVVWVVLGTRAGHLSILVALCLWVPAIAGATHFWWNQPRGVLQFDGLAWTLDRVASLTSVPLSLSAPPEVLLDLQGYLWARILPVGHSPLWLWLERSSQPERWMDLRRAVYSRASPGVDNADEAARQAAAGREP